MPQYFIPTVAGKLLANIGTPRKGLVRETRFVSLVQCCAQLMFFALNQEYFCTIMHTAVASSHNDSMIIEVASYDHKKTVIFPPKVLMENVASYTSKVYLFS